jgi:putative phosphoesterase
MKIAIVSDIHGNLEALNRVLEYIRENDIEEIYCLGDVVGYGPNPNECVELIRENCKAVLMGNHDYAAIGLANIEYFNEYAKISTYWTQDILSDENLEYLKSLPFTYTHDKFHLVHASPKNPSNWDYVLSVNDAKQQLKEFEGNICFIGHSHVPVIFSNSDYYRKKNFLFTDDQKYLVNVGSTGQPRDGDPRTCFVIYDDEQNSVEYVRLDYDIQKSYNKIINAGLPVFLAERLLKGY